MLKFSKLTTIFKSSFSFSKRSHTNLSYRHNPGKNPLKSSTLGILLEETALKYGNREAIVSRAQNKRLTYSEILNSADKLAAGFKVLGLIRGDRLGLWAPNSIEWHLTMMACARAGLILVGINPAYEASELEYAINKVGVKALICPYKSKRQNFYETISIIAPEIQDSKPGETSCLKLPSLNSVILTGAESLKGTFNFNEVLNLGNAHDIENIKTNQHLINFDDALNIQFTSGTTGKPKAAVLTHFQIVNNSNLIGIRNELDRKHHKICVQVPLFHAFGTVITAAAALNHGSTLVLPGPKFNPKESLEAIKAENCTIIHGTPTMYVDLIKAQKEECENINPEIAVSGGAICAPNLFKEMLSTLKVKKVRSVYGLTETTAVAFHSLPEDGEESTGTVGYLGEHLEVKIVDNQNSVVPLGVPGELCVRGYCNMLGYWNDEKKTKEMLGADGWLKTGDQFVLEEDGYGRIVGRLKDVIIRGGENIFPREIEDLLNTHPKILECYVIGLSHERLGEEVCACLRIVEGSTVTHNDVKEFCTGKMAYFKIPSQLRIVEEFPKTASGKVQKFQLRKQFEKNY